MVHLDSSSSPIEGWSLLSWLLIVVEYEIHHTVKSGRLVVVGRLEVSGVPDLLLSLIHI